MRSSRFTAALLPLALVAAGCNTIGPTALTTGRGEYNDALAETQAEQLLHNLVRIRYLEMPMFLEVTSVNTQYELRADAGASITGMFGNSLSESTGSARVGSGYTERPTVTYAPLQGDDFVKRIMSPLGLDTLSLMIRSGWRTEHVLIICLQAMGPAPNAPRATGPANEAEIDNELFLELVGSLGEATRSRGGRLVTDPDGNHHLEVNLANPHVVAWLEGMGVEPKETMRIYQGFTLDKSGISMQTRSLLGAMFYLSLSINLPQAHLDSGEVPLPPDPAIQDITKGFFSIHSSTDRPDKSFLATRFRDHWYYIESTDHRSKATFALLSLLFSLQSGGREATRPAVTIPLN